MFKRTIAAMLILAVTLCLGVKVDAADTRHTKDDTWLVYVYLCGSDLESNGHVSTKNIAEIQKVKLPPNVKVLIATGGATQWHHPTIKAGGDGIYLYSGSRLEKQADWNSDMGKPATLADFLKFGEENFEADHKVLIFRDHGGVNGICYNESLVKNAKGEIVKGYTNNLTYDDLNKAFADVYGNSPEEPPFELVGFGACMTGSYELAKSISNFSHYMVGSECSEYGWDFTPWIAALAEDPSMNGAQIGKVICDSALNNYDEITKLTNTFSVIDLTKMPKLREAYEEFFSEALTRANAETGFSGAFARAASARNVDKYSNLYTDLGLLAKNTKAIMPKESNKLLRAIDKAVVYNKHGAYLKSRGISTYYPYVSSEQPSVSKDDFKNFLRQSSTSDNQKKLYKELLNLNVSKLQGVPIEMKSNGHLVTKLDPAQLENVSMIQCMLVPITENSDSNLGLSGEGGIVLTSADDLKIDWKKGIITENFRGMQPVFDGHKIAMFASIRGRGHNFYSVPILVNGQARELNVRYDTSAKKYSIIGFGSSIENGMVRNLENNQLRSGDVITPIFLAIVSEENSAASGVPMIHYTDPKTGKAGSINLTFGEPFVYTKDSTITDKKISNGDYLYLFQFFAPNGTAIGSAPAAITVKYGEITRFDSEDVAEVANK